ncbi:MAG: hypothetical protein CM1200mP28_14180 [Deltaproteobacteria bacterium]|nr:MAG: hypothetical protein CM1200mP28_14180 [Deltaproteobacteria bacterium]
MSQPTDQDFEKDEENREDVIEVMKKLVRQFRKINLLLSVKMFFQNLYNCPLYDRLYFPKCFCR